MKTYRTISFKDSKYQKAFNLCHTYYLNKLEKMDIIFTYGDIIDIILKEYGIQYILMEDHKIIDEEKFLRFKLEWY